MSKKIDINPNLFKVNNKTLKNKRKPVKKNQNQNISSLRKKILDQLNKKTQEKKQPSVNKNVKNIKSTETDSFMNSMNFLEKELKENNPSVNTGKKPEITSISSTNKKSVNNNLNKNPNINKNTNINKNPNINKNLNSNNIKNNTDQIPVKNTKFEIIENVNLELPESLQEIKLNTDTVSQESNIKISTIPSNKCNTRKNRDEPEYGCLKNGVKPTLSKDKTAKNRLMFADKLEHYFDESDTLKNNTVLENETEPKAKIEVDDKPQISDEIVPLSLDEFPEEINNILPQKNPVSKPKSLIKDKSARNQSLINLKKNKNKLNKTIKILGKDEKRKKVSLIINNNNMRKTIKKEKHILNTTPIKKIKKYLKEKGLIQVDSNAPEDVLRTIYTNSKLSGDVENSNGDMLINNYMNDKELNDEK